jgi:hypothetical protein
MSQKTARGKTHFPIASRGCKIKSTMRIRSVLRCCLPAVAVACLAFGVVCVRLMRAQTMAAAQTKILMPEDVSKIMPSSVFFRGQSATVQLRNTFGLRFPDDALVLAGLVDSSGYSSGIKQKYQGYLLSEVPLNIEGKTLSAGAYGFGFLANDVFLVMDLGGHDVLRAAVQTDAAMSRPRPLAMEAGKQAGSYRLYEGRKFISLRAAKP